MKVMVGTLACGEGDLPECLRALQGQTLDFEHVLIENRPEGEAHRALYEAFHTSGCDCLVKVDADMVLTGTGTLGMIVSRLETTGVPCVSHLVDDFFTGGPIFGLLAHTQDVRHDLDAIGTHDLFPDRRNSLSRSPAEERAKLRVEFNDVVAKHAHHCSDLQAFHYGYHRWLKQQWSVCAKVAAQARDTREPRLAWACRGMLAARACSDARAASYGALLSALAHDAAERWTGEAAVDAAAREVARRGPAAPAQAAGARA